MTAAEGSTGPTLQDPRRTSTDNSLATDQQQDAFKMDGITTATSTITTVPRHHDMPAFTYCKLKHLAHLSHTSQICRRYASNSLSDSASERATSTSTSSPFRTLTIPPKKELASSIWAVLVFLLLFLALDLRRLHLLPFLFLLLEATGSSASERREDGLITTRRQDRWR
jgi:hypothetical protein